MWAEWTIKESYIYGEVRIYLIINNICYTQLDNKGIVGNNNK